MNGQFPSPAAADSRPCQPAPWWADADSAALRLSVALALSCLLHAALVFLPLFGKSTIETRLAFKGSQKIPPAINATLALVGDNRFVARSVPPAAVIKPEAAAADRLAEEQQLQTQHGAEGADLLPLPALGYYTTDQLTKRPQPLTTAELDRPEISPFVVSGKIVLRLWINEFGSVAEVEVETSDLSEIFSRTAVAAFRNLRFTPGERNGLPVGTVMRIEVTYADGRGPAP
jgi:TonB family protein